METYDVINLIEQAEQLFDSYPLHQINMEKANPFLVLRYRSILNSIANSIIYNNVSKFGKAANAYKVIYKSFKREEKKDNA